MSFLLIGYYKTPNKPQDGIIIRLPHLYSVKTVVNNKKYCLCAVGHELIFTKLNIVCISTVMQTDYKKLLRKFHIWRIRYINYICLCLNCYGGKKCIPATFINQCCWCKKYNTTVRQCRFPDCVTDLRLLE